MILKMAWRNLWRNRRRTIITVISVAFGLWLSSTMTGLGGYMYTKMIDDSARMGLGHVTVQPRGYQDKPLLKTRLAGAITMQDMLKKQKGVTQAVARISGSAMFSTARKSVGGAFMAVDPQEEITETNLILKNIKEGSVFKSSNSQGALIGAGMAEKMKLQIGKRLIYTFTDVNGDLSSGRSKITGIFKTGVSEVDNYMVILPRETVAGHLGYAKGEATMISVFLEDQRDSKATASLAAELIADSRIEILTFDQTQPEIAGMVAMDKTFNYIIQGIIGLLIAIGVFNTLLMSVLERKQEFGIMMAVGLSPGRLFSMIVGESLWIGMLGLAAGTVMTVPWYIFMSRTGLDFTNLAKDGFDANGVAIELIYHIRLFPEQALAIFAALMVLTLAAACYPAWKAGRISPVESIRGL